MVTLIPSIIMFDLKLTTDGDLQLLPNGELASTKDTHELFEQYLWLFLKTIPGTGYTSPDFGVGLDRYIGHQNIDMDKFIRGRMAQESLFTPFENMMNQFSLRQKIS